MAATVAVGVVHANHQASVALVGQPDHHRLSRIVHVPGDPVALLMEGPSHDHARDVRARPTPPLPAAHHLRIRLGTGHVRKWNLQAAPQRPQLVRALDLDVQLVAGDLDWRRANSAPWIPCTF
jgi:hypothetical protein